MDLLVEADDEDEDDIIATSAAFAVAWSQCLDSAGVCGCVRIVHRLLTACSPAPLWEHSHGMSAATGYVVAVDSVVAVERTES